MMDGREKLEALFQLESKQLDLVEQANEQTAARSQPNKRVKPVAERLVYETNAQLLCTHIYDLQQTYIMLIKSAETPEECKRLITHYDQKIAELRKLLAAEG